MFLVMTIFSFISFRCNTPSVTWFLGLHLVHVESLVWLSTSGIGPLYHDGGKKINKKRLKEWAISRGWLWFTTAVA